MPRTTVPETGSTNGTSAPTRQPSSSARSSEPSQAATPSRTRSRASGLPARPSCDSSDRSSLGPTLATSREADRSSAACGRVAEAEGAPARHLVSGLADRLHQLVGHVGRLGLGLQTGLVLASRRGGPGPDSQQAST